MASSKAPRTETCPACERRPGAVERCVRCGGIGLVKVVVPEAEDGPPAEAMPVLEAWSAIERYGLDGWLRLERSRLGNRELEPHPELMEALAIVDGELARLEAEEE